jgi:steroid delta-isomerase-like uncharacterized protein
MAESSSSATLPGCIGSLLGRFEKGGIMSDTEALARGYIEEFWNKAREQYVDETFAPEAIYRDPMLPDLPRGPEGAKQRKATYLSALSDDHVDIDDIAAGDDTVAVRWTFTGKFTGEFMGSQPTGDTITVTGIHFFRIANGKIAEVSTQYDAAGFLSQVGVIDLGGR